MNKLFLLLKNYGKIYLGAISKKSNKKDYLGGGAIIGLVGILFVVLFSSTAITTISQFLALDPPQPIYALYVLTSTGLIFMLLTVVLRGTSMKKANDHDLLLSLPLNKTVIVLSKILKDFIFDFISLILIMLPGYVCYYIMVDGASILVVVFGLITILLLTFVSNALAIFLNTMIFKFTKRLRFAEVIQTIVSVIITIAFIVVYYFVNMAMTSSTDFIVKYLDFYPLQVIVKFVSTGDILSFVVLFLACIIPFILSVILNISDFNKQSNSYVNTNKELIYEKNSVSKDLFKKEISSYFRSSLYVLNTIVGALFVILFAFIIWGFGIKRIENMLSTLVPDSSKFLSYINIIIVLMAQIVASTVITTSPSISLEGKNFWILKVHPISEKDIFKAKIGLNLIIGGIPIIISSIVLTITLGIEYFFFVLVLPMLALVYAAISGLYNNLKYYRLDWKDEQEVIKQGMSVLISLGTGILPGILLTIGYFILASFINPFIYLSICVIIMIIIVFLMYKRLVTKGIVLFRNIVE